MPKQPTAWKDWVGLKPPAPGPCSRIEKRVETFKRAWEGTWLRALVAFPSCFELVPHCNLSHQSCSTLQKTIAKLTVTSVGLTALELSSSNLFMLMHERLACLFLNCCYLRTSRPWSRQKVSCSCKCPCKERTTEIPLSQGRTGKVLVDIVEKWV